MKLHNPVFKEGYTPGKDLDPDAIRAERRKLKNKLKKERKGALRELRRDTEFLEQQRRQERERDELERAERHRAIMRDLEEQARDTNIFSGKAKTKKKKR